MIYARIAAVTYVAWGILHLGAAYGVYQLGTTLDAGILQGRIYQGAWNLTFFAGPRHRSTGARCPWSGALDHRSCALDHRVEKRTAFATSTYVKAIK